MIGKEESRRGRGKQRSWEEWTWGGGVDGGTRQAAGRGGAGSKGAAASVG